jgi:hypothetical protein
MNKKILKIITEELDEMIDSELNLIGYNDVPQNSPDMASNVGSKPTDYNVGISQQDYSDNDLAKVGLFPNMYVHEDESSETEHDKLAKIIYDKVVAMLKQNNEISEASVVEDKLTNKKDTSITDKKDNDGLPREVKRITDLIADLAREDKELLSKTLNK